MRSLNLDQLRTLVAIADLGTFASAAQALHLAPPTVSLHVSELEARLGVGLLERGGRRVLPTAAGRALVDRARRLLHDAEDAVDLVRRHAEGRAGKVRLGTATGVLTHLLPPVLERLRAQHPALEVDIRITGSAEALAGLAARTLDIGIVSLPQPAGDLVCTPWRRDPMMAFLPEGWDAPDTVTAAWLAERPLIANDPSTHMQRIIAEWFAQCGLAPRARIELNYTEAMKSLVAAGYGAAVLPWEHAEAPFASAHPALPPGTQVRPLQPALVRHLGIAHRPPTQLDAATRHVLAALG